MPRPCSVYGCRSNHDVSSPYYPTYSVPRNEALKPLWLRHISPCIPNPVVCSKHFSEASFQRIDALLVNGEVLYHSGKRKLKPEAVPTIFPDGSGYIRNRQSAIEQLPYCDDYSSSRLWQGGGANVVLSGQGTPGVNSGTIDLGPNPTAPPGSLIPNPSLRAPISGFIPISDQMRARGNQYMSMYGYGQPAKYMQTNSGPATTPPLCGPPAPLAPDVKFKKLPFYDLLGELLKPTALTASGTNSSRESVCGFQFFLTPKQASEVSMNREVGPGTRNEYVVQVQLRFCVMDTTTEQEDSFPSACSVKINGKLASLPQNPLPSNKQGVEPKRPSRPVNISHLVKLCPSVMQQLQITWNAEYQRLYVVTVNLVRKLSSQDLLERLKARGAQNPEFTTSLIKDKLSDSDNDVATTVLRISLSCPLGKMRMQTPCRSSSCVHLQCFDAGIFICMNEKRPTWTCPVCNKPSTYDSLVIDGYFQEVLDSPLLGSDCSEITLNKDGSWSSHDSKDDAPQSCSLTPSKADATLSVDSPKADQVEEIDDEDDEPTPAENGDSRTSSHSEKTETHKEKEKDVIVVDLTTSDDEESPPPPPPNPAKEVHPPPIIVPPIAAKLDHAFSDSSSNLSATRSPPSIINLDSPSPSPPLSFLPSSGVVSPPSNYMCHMRLAPDSRYHPY